MRRILWLLAGALSLCGAAPPKPKPKLVLFVVVDQCRYDYMTRFRAEFTGGFDRLLKGGASFTADNNDFFPTLTAVGHATLLTGAMPSATGIIGNDWYDYRAGKAITSVTDDKTHLVGAPGPGASPRLLLAATVGDQLKKASGGRSRVIGISSKDRSAILLTGASANGAYWIDEATGQFVTSSYYQSSLPKWVATFNAGHPADRYLGAVWQGHTIAKDEKPRYRAVEWSPFANDLTESLAEQAVLANGLGKRRDPDLLALSLSATDYVGHTYGPDSAELHETLLHTDQLLGKLFQVLDREVGMANVLVILTSDHGVPPMPAKGAHFPLSVVTDAVQTALVEKYGAGAWVLGTYDALIYLNRGLMTERKLDAAAVNRTAAQALAAVPHIARVFTREDLMDERQTRDAGARLVKNGFYRERAADLVFLPEEFYVFHRLNTTHGSTYGYDTHIPLIFLGPGIRAGSYGEAVRSNDVAPTLARILNVPKPAESTGRVLTEMLGN